MQALDLAGGGGRIGSGEEVSDPVVEADTVEQHIGGLVGAAGEDLAVVSEDLLGDPVGVERFQERVAHRAAPSPSPPPWR